MHHYFYQTQSRLLHHNPRKKPGDLIELLHLTIMSKIEILPTQPILFECHLLVQSEYMIVYDYQMTSDRKINRSPIPMIVTIAPGDRDYSRPSKGECNHCGGEVPDPRHVLHVDFDKTSMSPSTSDNSLAILRPSPCGCSHSDSGHRHSPHFKKDSTDR